MVQTYLLQHPQHNSNLEENINENGQDDDDLPTQHTSWENPILEIPFTERLVNLYKYQIIIPHNPNCILPSITTIKIKILDIL